MPGGPEDDDEDENKEGETWFAGGERRCVGDDFFPIST